MKVLLDTCAIIWTASEPESLSSAAREILTAPETTVGVSVISCAELACLQERKRIEIAEHWKTWFNRCLSVNRWHVWDVDLSVMQEAYSLPGLFHPDPTDRILVASARVHALTVITADHRILEYPHVSSLW